MTITEVVTCVVAPTQSPTSSSSSVLYYTTHHNWDWVVSTAITNTSALYNSSSFHCKLLRELPSQKNRKEKPTYSLFRVELIDADGDNNNNSSVWSVSSAFAKLDSKDALYFALSENDASHLMPMTVLIEHDINSVDQIEIDIFTDNSVNVSNSFNGTICTTMLLKAACGSGGFGLYKVNRKQDILKIIQYHASCARNHRGFLENLKENNNGKVPCWSLQAFLSSTRVLNNRKCQVRVYVVYCEENNSLYLYNDFEVRLPYWIPEEEVEEDKDDKKQNNEMKFNEYNDARKTSPVNSSVGTTSSSATAQITNEILLSTSSAETMCTITNTNIISTTNNVTSSSSSLVFDFEQACVADTNAIPYNHHRMKEQTERYMLSELSEISYARKDVYNCVKKAMIALKPSIAAAATASLSSQKIASNDSGSIDSNSASNRCSLGIAGIDLILYEDEESDDSNNNNNADDDADNEINDQPGNITITSDDTVDLSTAHKETNNNTDSNKNNKCINNKKKKVLIPKILEMNHNPAMPGLNKRMSVMYKQHLITFVGNTIQLGLTLSGTSTGKNSASENKRDGFNFEKVW